MLLEAGDLELDFWQGLHKGDGLLYLQAKMQIKGFMYITYRRLWLISACAYESKW